jgi:hypothetical protein
VSAALSLQGAKDHHQDVEHPGGSVAAWARLGSVAQKPHATPDSAPHSRSDLTDSAGATHGDQCEEQATHLAQERDDSEVDSTGSETAGEVDGAVASRRRHARRPPMKQAWPIERQTPAASPPDEDVGAGQRGYSVAARQ